MIRLLTILFVVGVLTASYANAAPFNWGNQLNAGETACPSGPPVLNVTRKVVNSMDSMVGKNSDGFPYWATSEYVQQISVVEMEAGMFCATVKTQGSFESVKGDGPGCAEDVNDACLEIAEDGSLAAGVTGTLQGGQTETFEGIFAPVDMPTKGNIGTLDHGCDAATAAGCTAPGFSSWRSDYFPGGVSGLDAPWWGWIYHAGNNGTWVNKIDGNEGNITGD